MLETLFPRQLTNDYRGSPIAKWVFVLLTGVTIVRSLIHVCAPDGGAQTIATIPLDSFTQNGAAAVTMIFALWGLSQLLLGFVYVAVLYRYQALIPFMYLLVFVEYAARIAIGAFKPLETTGMAPGAVGNFIIVPLAAVMLVLSLRQRRSTTP
jgi:hypothetical protein